MNCVIKNESIWQKNLRIDEILVRDGWKQVTDMTGARHMNKIAEATQELMTVLAKHGEETGNSTTTTTTGGGQVREYFKLKFLRK